MRILDFCDDDDDDDDDESLIEQFIWISSFYELLEEECHFIECQRPRFPLLRLSILINSSHEQLDAEAEKTKALPYLFPNQKPGKFPVNKGGKDHLGELGKEQFNKGGKDHLGELGKEQFNKGGKDPGHDGWDFVLDVEPQIMRMTSLAA